MLNRAERRGNYVANGNNGAALQNTLRIGDATERWTNCAIDRGGGVGLGVGGHVWAIQSSGVSRMGRK